MSELRTNRIIPRDGLPSGSSGGIIQVVFAQTNTEFTTCIIPPLAPDTIPSLGMIRLVLNSDIMLRPPS